MKNFKDKVAVITGAGSGMGQELALQLAAEGCNIALVEWKEDLLNETKELLKKHNVGVSSHLVDVSDKEAIDNLPNEVIENHGQVDIVFNNAGLSVATKVEDSTDEDWDFGLGILLYGVINSTRAFLPHLKERPESAIVNTSSIFGLLSVPTQSIYHVGKFGVRGFTESLALEMQLNNESVEVYSVHPGHIGTNIFSASRFKNFEPGTSLFGEANTPEEAGKIFKENAPTSAKSAAKIILKNIRKKNKRILVGVDAHMYDLAQRIFPKWYIYLLPLIPLIRNLFPKDKIS